MSAGKLFKMFSLSFIILSGAMQFPFFVLFSEWCSIIKLYLIGLDLSRHHWEEGRWECRKEVGRSQHRRWGMEIEPEARYQGTHSTAFYLKLLVAT